jgi:hypothetical protein
MIFAVEPAQDSHIEAIVANLREHDKPTFAATPDPAQALRDVVRKCTGSYVALLDGELLCLWAADVRTVLSDAIFLCMVTTTAAERHPTVFARHAIRIIRNILEEYGQIEGTVVTTNAIAIKWVSWLGAALTETSVPGVLEFRLTQASHPRWRA